MPLTPIVLENFIREYGNDITCICFMGGDAEPEYVNVLARFLRREYPQYKIGWYSGRQRIPSKVRKSDFDYIKVGPYIKHLGCLKTRPPISVFTSVCREMILPISHIVFGKTP